MNLTVRFDEINDFLNTYKGFWDNEVLYSYPQDHFHCPKEWIEELNSFSLDKLYQFEGQRDHSLIKNPSFSSFLKKIKSLSELEYFSNEFSVQRNLISHIKGKKLHEIKRILAFIDNNKEKKIIDIGGGKGLLAQNICHHLRIPTLSIDADKDLQENGLKRHLQYLNKDCSSLNYINQKIFFNSPSMKEVKNNFIVGLHGCGDLSPSTINLGMKNGARKILNFGCCYYKIDHPKNYNHSQYSKKHGLVFTKEALNLATIPYSTMSENDFLLKQKVKSYRYGIHFLLHDFYNQKDLIKLGPSLISLYKKWNFNQYVQHQLKNLNFTTPKLSEDFLTNYFQENKERINKYLCANIIRCELSRLLELYINLDRGIWLEENGYQVQLLEFFDINLSPRNIGIFAIKK